MSIKIKSLQVESLNKRSTKTNYLYKDLELDLKNAVYLNDQLNRKESLNDVSALYDIESIKNSIVTAFLTSPGDKILNPTYGVDLRRYIFEPIDDFTMDIIKDDIESKLPIAEPRIDVINVDVWGDEESNIIYIDLQIDVPSLGITGLSIKSELKSSGYTIL